MSESYGDASKHYKTMSIDEICELPIKEITEENAVLFLWTTVPFLEKSFKVVNAWGFKYKTIFVWDKIKHNFGWYSSVRHEILIVATKGSFTPENPKLFDSVIENIEDVEITAHIEREKHSQKPDWFRTNLIEVLYPSSKKIELFARQKVDGWDCWGNEV